MSSFPTLGGPGSGLGRGAGFGGGLGSLAQAAREKQINNARWILLFVGVGFAAWHGFLLYGAEAEFQGLVNAGRITPQAMVQGLGVSRVVLGGAVVLGVVFCLLGLFVKAEPVLTTILGLVLYIGAQALFMYLDPSTIRQGLWMKLAIVIGLARAVGAAIAFQAERQAQQRPATFGPEETLPDPFATDRSRFGTGVDPYGMEVDRYGMVGDR